MHLVIDIGNTIAKLAAFQGESLIEVQKDFSGTLEMLSGFVEKYNFRKGIVSSVAGANAEVQTRLNSLSFPIIEFSHKTPVPIRNAYRTPETLGMDRLAAVVGAVSMRPSTPLLIVDAGTAITYDFVDETGVYWGGNISPGIETRFKALHTFCARLPLVKQDGDMPDFGYSTETAIRSGVLRGVQLEIEGYIAEMKQQKPELFTFLTGGGAFSFDVKAKNDIFADVFLVLKGLNSILNYNEVNP